jgi:hypothetical protein
MDLTPIVTAVALLACSLCAAAPSGVAPTTDLYPDLSAYLDERAAEFDRISADRKAVLESSRRTSAQSPSRRSPRT